MKRPNKYDFDLTEDYESNLETYCDELEKALDKACDVISSDVCINCYSCYFEKECNYKKDVKCIANNMNKDEWKEWLMKDVD